MFKEIAFGGRFWAHRMWVMQLARQEVAVPAAAGPVGVATLHAFF